MIFLDINRFRFINDTFGHHIGDQLLRDVASRLKSTFEIDSTIARISADLFAILVPDVKNESQLTLAAEKILKAFNLPFYINGSELFITISIGISMYPFDGLSINTIFKNADTALNRSKEKGGNMYQFYQESMNGRALERLTLVMNLRKALEKEEFFILYQPQLNLKTGKICGTEALLRWKHPFLGTISPAMFIPIAEETGLIITIGDWILKTVCRQLKKWHDMGFSDIIMSENISGRQFDDAALVQNIKNALEENKLDSKYLELEITESILFHNKVKAREIIGELKAIGVNAAIDDFGTGFSSLNYLMKFDLDILKIDQAFVREICIDYKDAAVTSAIITMAHSLDLIVVAEGVETKEQLAMLKEQNCDKIQGYYFSKPVLPEEIEKMLYENRGIY